MSQRECQNTPPALRPDRARGPCIVCVCTDASEADAIGRQLSQLDHGCSVGYRRCEDLMGNPPRLEASLVVLATDEAPRALQRTLRWLRGRWPRCSVVVVGDEGCGPQERAAREGAASYLTRPVTPQQWAALLAHAETRRPALPRRTPVR